MALRISTNMASINAQSSLDRSQRAIEKSFSQLSSGSRITKAADDAAGLTISENLKSRVRGLDQAKRNANDAMSVIQVAEGGLNEIGNILVRLRELGVQAASDSVSDNERGFIDKEVQQLKQEVDRIALTTRFGSVQLLDGTGETFDFQVDLGNDDFQDRISFKASDIQATTDVLKIDDFDFSDKGGARGSLEFVEAAQTKVNEYRSNLGALQNRLISTQENLSTQVENLSSANSRMRDADIAQSTADLTRGNILLNASTAILAQANEAPKMALSLLR